MLALGQGALCSLQGKAELVCPKAVLCLSCHSCIMLLLWTADWYPEEAALRRCCRTHRRSPSLMGSLRDTLLRTGGRLQMAGALPCSLRSLQEWHGDEAQ